LVTERRPGLHHVTNQGAASRYTLAVEAVSLAGFDTGIVVPITASELDPPRPATRPKQSVLDNAALRLAGIPLLADYHEPLERLVKELTSERAPQRSEERSSMNRAVPHSAVQPPKAAAR